MVAKQERWPIQNFPFLVGRVSLFENWSIELPFAFQQRFVEKQLVLWRPGFTIWLSIWNNEKISSIDDRLSKFAAAASDGKFDETRTDGNGTTCYSYRLKEQAGDDRVAALQGFVFSTDSHLQASIYFDDENDATIALQILNSAGDFEPTISDSSVLSKLCFATNMVIEVGDDGTPRKLADVTYMYREEPDSSEDSGWRFFSGMETQEYMDDPENTQVYPVAFVAEIDDAVVAYLAQEIGEYGREGDHFIQEG